MSERWTQVVLLGSLRPARSGVGLARRLPLGVVRAPRKAGATMTTCLLCPAPAVADGLYVEDGARLHVARTWKHFPAQAEYLTAHAGVVADRTQRAAFVELSTGDFARAFLDKLEAARKAREVTT
jgi:hypothetical protein